MRKEIMHRRSILAAVPSVLLAGCIGNNDDSTSEPGESRIQLNTVTETQPPNNTPDTHRNVLFKEHVNENAVTIATTITSNGCAALNINGTELNNNTAQITVTRGNKTHPDGMRCTATFEPRSLAVKATFDTLPNNAAIKFTTMRYSNPVTYTIQNEETETVLQHDRSVASHDDNAVQQ